MIFRSMPNPGTGLTEEQVQAGIKFWQDWIGGIAAQGRFVSTNQLGMEGKTLRANKTITDGPFAELKEIVGGYLIVKAENLEAAVSLADGCPIFSFGGQVEVRDIVKRP